MIIDKHNPVIQAFKEALKVHSFTYDMHFKDDGRLQIDIFKNKKLGFSYVTTSPIAYAFEVEYVFRELTIAKSLHAAWASKFNLERLTSVPLIPKVYDIDTFNTALLFGIVEDHAKAINKPIRFELRTGEAGKITCLLMETKHQPMLMSYDITTTKQLVQRVVAFIMRPNMFEEFEEFVGDNELTAVVEIIHGFCIGAHKRQVSFVNVDGVIKLSVSLKRVRKG